MYRGDFPANGTVRFLWDSISIVSGSITRGTDGTIRIYKDGSATQRASSSGITDTEDFDSLTGVHLVAIDLSDDADPGFYAAGSTYDVVLAGAVIDGLTVNPVLGSFSIEAAGGTLALIADIWRIHGLDTDNPMTVTRHSRTAGSIVQAIDGDGANTSTVTRTA